MEKQKLKAVFENGVFRPVSPLTVPINEGQQVQLVIEEDTNLPEDPLKLAMQVFDGLSDEEINEIEQIILDRSDFFGESR